VCAQVNKALNDAMETAGEAVKHSLRKTNNIKLMVDAGSKGNMINICQIIACVGQVCVRVCVCECVWAGGSVRLCVLSLL